MEKITQHIEALLFTAQHPLSIGTIKSVLEETFKISFTESFLLENMAYLQQRYSEDQFAFEIVEIAGGFQFLTRGHFMP